MTNRTDVLGTTTDLDYSDTSAFPRNSQGNAQDRLRVADSRGADQATILERTIYEPLFNKPFQIINPRGFEPGNTPAQFTSTYLFDYMEDLAQAKVQFASQLGLTESELQQLFDDDYFTVQTGRLIASGFKQLIPAGIVDDTDLDVAFRP